MPYRDDEYDGLDEHEFPDPDDADEITAPCPRCGASIYHDSEQCPRCGRYLTGDAPHKKPAWMVATILVCLAMAVAWALLLL